MLNRRMAAEGLPSLALFIAVGPGLICGDAPCLLAVLCHPATLSLALLRVCVAIKSQRLLGHAAARCGPFDQYQPGQLVLIPPSGRNLMVVGR